MFKDKVQVIIYVIFAVAIVAAIGIFASNVNFGSSGGGPVIKGKIEIWGTVPFQTMQKYTEQISNNDLKVTYRAVGEKNFEEAIIEAWASGTGPDIILARQEIITRNTSKLFPVPYSSFSQADYKKLYIDISDLFLTDSGILAFPITLNPLVTYYNRDILSSSFITEPPSTWREIIQLGRDITEESETGLILKSAVALGTFNNIKNSKDILSAMLIQGGNNIIGTQDERKISLIANDSNSQKIVKDVFAIYTSFASPKSDNYSWNESLSQDIDAFLFGDLAIYFGFADEIVNLRKKNPNLNFDVTFFPQFETSPNKITFGRMHGLAISKLSKNIPAAVFVASKLSDVDTVKELAKDMSMVPARRNLLGNTVGKKAENVVFFKSGIISRGWFDPDYRNTEAFFKKMIEDINSGISSIESATKRLHSDLNNLLR